jgi:uncharacterized protein YjbI with pentapeptide repeats
MKKITIKDINNNIIFEHIQSNNTIRITVELAIKSNADLHNADLHNADLNNADLFCADLSNANLHNADLFYANLFNANLFNANLSNANLFNANLHNANLSNANLSNANLHNANLHNANLFNANLHNAALFCADLSNANLHNANLHNADLHNADLTDIKICNIYRSNLNILKLQKNNIFVFKYLRKNLKSPYQNFQYNIGKTYISENSNNNEFIQCGAGINVATLEWCLTNCGNNLIDYVIVECEVNPKDLIIPFNSDGKFRIKSGGKVKINRILTEKEIEKILNN